MNAFVQKTRFVPLTHSRTREVVDVIEGRLLLACEELRPVGIEVETDLGGRVKITIDVGDRIAERELSDDEARAALTQAFERIKNRGA
jgi:hypothetical protein